MNIRSLPSTTLFGLCLLLTPAMPCQAQWLKQSFPLKTGWNAIYFHVDLSYTNLDQILSSANSAAIQEIWQWTPTLSQAGDLSDPRTPTEPDFWAHWTRGGSPSDTLDRLHGNVACLVRSTSEFRWEVTGRPVVSAYRWTTSGLNFVGFPTPQGPDAPFIADYFAPAPNLRNGGQFYTYFGGDSTEPQEILDPSDTRLRRGQAFWVKSFDGTYNRYFSPFEVVAPGESGVRFGESAGQISLRLRNMTQKPVTVSLGRIASDRAPTDPAPEPTEIHHGQVPVLIRGEATGDPFNHNYKSIALDARRPSWTLQPKGDAGSEVEIVLGCDRQRLIGNQGDLFASLLRFTDSHHQAQIDVPVSARVGSTRGLWVGNAVVSQVEPYLNTYYTATNAAQFTNLITSTLEPHEGEDGLHYEWDSASGRILAFGGGSWALQASDIRGATTLIRQLQAPKDPVSDYLRTDRLSASTRSALDAWNDATAPSEELQSAVLLDLNEQVIAGAPLWDSTRFAQVALRSETQGLAGKNPAGWDLQRLQRLLLEDAYPDDLSRNRSTQKLGSYVRKVVATGGNDVPRPFSLRLILHQGADSLQLLQKVHHGIGLGGEVILTPNAASLDPSKLAEARRISSVHLPIAANDQPWSAAGGVQLAAAQSASFEVTTAAGDARSNPFIHRFHPDHDNLTADFPPQPAPTGEESFDIQRRITLKFAAPGVDFDSRTRAATSLLGEYDEVVTFTGRAGSRRQFTSRGDFLLNRISDIETLTP